MSGYPYGGNPPQYPPPQNQIYPQIYNPANAPPPGQPGHQAMGYPSPGQPYPPGLSFPYPGHPGQPGQPVHPSQHPAAMSYPGMQATAPTPTPAYGYQPYAPSQSTPIVEWIPTTPQNAHTLTDRAVVAGYEGHDNSPLWVIRAIYEGDMIPGKLAIKHNSAYVPWGGKENSVFNIEVCCARPDRVRWCTASNGIVPPNALPAGNTASGEVLYVGRAREQGSLTPGKVHPSHKTMYISFAGQEVPHKTYEVLCTV